MKQPWSVRDPARSRFGNAARLDVKEWTSGRRATEQPRFKGLTIGPASNKIIVDLVPAQMADTPLQGLVLIESVRPESLLIYSIKNSSRTNRPYLKPPYAKKISIAPDYCGRWTPERQVFAGTSYVLPKDFQVFRKSRSQHRLQYISSDELRRFPLQNHG